MPTLTRKTLLLSTTTVLLAAAAHAALGGPAGVVIPFTGRLELNGALASGAADFQFKVMVNGTTTTVCDTKTVVSVPVTRGEFALSIPAVLEACVKGQDVHLIVSVRQDGGAFIELGKQRVTPVLSATTSGAGDFHVAGEFSQGVVNGTSVVLANGEMKFKNSALPSQNVTIDNNEVTSTAADNVSLSEVFLKGSPVHIGGDGGNTPPANRLGSVIVNAPAFFQRAVRIFAALTTDDLTVLGQASVVGDLTVDGDINAAPCKSTAGTQPVGAWCMSGVRAAANQGVSIRDCEDEGMAVCSYDALAACDEANVARVAFCNSVLDDTSVTFVRTSDISPRGGNSLLLANGSVPLRLGFNPSSNGLFDLPADLGAPYFCCVARYQQ